MFHGSMVAIVTPFHQGKIDVSRFQALIEWHMTEGTKGIIVAGTTGESATLSPEEWEKLIKVALDVSNERIPIIAGAHDNGTKATTKKAQKALELGAHACLIMTPAYIKPTQQGLIEHYRYIAKETPIPIILYNVPSRTACDMQPETVKTLSQLSNIIAIKEATGQLDRLKKLISLECECDIFSGDDETAYEWMLNGAKGVISVTANIAPRLMSKLCEAALFDNQEIASAIQTQLLPLHQYLFKETNPIPVKWALSKLGKIHDELRLPLTSFSNAYHEQMMIILKQLAMV